MPVILPMREFCIEKASVPRVSRFGRSIILAIDVQLLNANDPIVVSDADKFIFARAE